MQDITNDNGSQLILQCKEQSSKQGLSKIEIVKLFGESACKQINLIFITIEIKWNSKREFPDNKTLIIKNVPPTIGKPIKIEHFKLWDNII